MNHKIIKSFRQTIPVMAAYLFLGSAFGILVQANGFSIWIAICMSLFIYSGALQFASIPLLVNPTSLLQAFILSLSLSARHLFYGLSLLIPFEKIKKYKMYMIFALTDESYSLLLNNTDDTETMFYIELMNHGYWVIGTIFGYLFGAIIPYSIEGIEFSMTALFIVIFLEKLFEGNKEALAIGFISSLVSLLVFGSQYFIIPSMFFILIILKLRRDV